MSAYLLVNIFSIFLPLLLSFSGKYNFRKNWSVLFPSIFLTGLFFILWDIIFTDVGVWGFNENYLLGIDLFNLPVEEWLFFISIPYACVFTYFAFNEISDKTYFKKYISHFTTILAVFLIIISAQNIDRLYTFVTFSMTGLFLLLHVYILKSDYLEHFFRAYIFVFLFPFLIVNGILTGSFIDGEIVWYNNLENLSIRIYTIPIEDFVYGMLLFLMNVTFYEFFLSKKPGY